MFHLQSQASNFFCTTMGLASVNELLALAYGQGRQYLGNFHKHNYHWVGVLRQCKYFFKIIVRRFPHEQDTFKMINTVLQ